MTVKFIATKLPSNKIGKLPVDDNGYYTIQIGALNTYNSAGEYYTLKGAKDLFESSSSFMRRVNNGCLKSETGHPRFLPGMTEEDYIRRMYDIDEKNTCAHIKEVWLNYDSNKSYVGILAKLKPAGPNGQALAEALENTNQNVCFSIRGVTDNYLERGKVYRVLKSIITWDWVNEPGISSSTKWATPVLEDITNIHLTKNKLLNIFNSPIELATESNIIPIKETLELFDTSIKKPIYNNW